MKNLILTLGLICLFSIINQAQEKVSIKESKSDEKNVMIDIKDNENPAVYINGKRYDSEIFDLIDKNKIESITILKGTEALEKYKEDYVLLITTKKEDKNTPKKEMKRDDGSTKVTFRSLSLDGHDESKSPKIIIDGVERDKEALSILSPDDIYSIKVLKDKESMKKYKAEYGIVLITTKKKKD